MISYEVRAAIEALPGKTVQPWKDGDPPCHCTHCDLCGRLFRTQDIGKHIDECQAALIAALNKAEEKTMDRRDESVTYGALIDALRSAGEGIAKDNRWNDDSISKTAKNETEDLARSVASILEQHIEEDATDDANVRDMRREDMLGVTKRTLDGFAASLADKAKIAVDSVSPKPRAPIVFHGWRVVKVAPGTYDELNMRSFGGIVDFNTNDAAELAADLPRMLAEPEPPKPRGKPRGKPKAKVTRASWRAWSRLPTAPRT